MNPVVGLDVSKGESQVQAFLDKNKPYRKSFSIEHNLKGLESFLVFPRDVEQLADGHQPTVVLEINWALPPFHNFFIKLL